MNNNYDPNQNNNNNYGNYGNYGNYDQQQNYGNFNNDQTQNTYGNYYNNYGYQQPLYRRPDLNPTPFFVMAIVGLALSVSMWLSIAGIIVSAIALGKAKNFIAAGGLYEGKAKVGKILSTVGLWVGVGMSVVFVIYIISLIVLAASGSYYDPYYYYY